jgi:tRNA (guanosine-2'-O-)-methyltransferase
MKRQIIRQPPPAQGSSEVRALFDHLSDYLTAARRKRLVDVLSRRTRRLTVVLEDIRKSHNVSAVLRTCDAFGVQDVHVVEPREPFEAAAKIALGTQQWLTIHEYPAKGGAAECVRRLRDDGYRIVATTPPGPRTVRFDELDLDTPLAIAFGNEKEGLTETVEAAADCFVTIPMDGFVESLNISVAAAVILQSLTTRLRLTDVPWGLSDEEKFELLFDWTRQSVPSIEAIEQRWSETRNAGAASQG